MLSASYKLCPSCRTRAGAQSRYCPTCGNDLASIEANAGDPYLGMVLADKYELEELIGEGAMGRVYKAKQLALGKPFAAKILAPHLMNDEASHARFASEAHNAASLNHPNCVSVVDYGRSPDGVTYIVMEYIQGLSLEQIIAQQHPLARDRIIDLTLQILAALTESHGLGILHRDLKPENILVQQLRTHGELAKVLDFGIAKLMEDQAQAGSGLTSQGMVCGTPEYMSPEQARGRKLDARSDLYSVGVILYQMLTGRPPFESTSAVEILHKHLHEQPVPPSKLLGIPPDPLEAVCLRALAKDPDARHASAAEFREDLIATTSTPALDTMQCKRCGASVRADHRFCPSCGKPSPQPASAVRRRSSPRGSGLLPPRPLGAAPTAEVVVRSFPLPLAGREHVFERAKTVLSRPTQGVRVRVLTGPRGIGKTRMGDEIASLAESMGWRAYYVGHDPSGARSPLWPIQCMVAQLLGFDRFKGTTQDLGRVANLSGLAFEELPGLAELFELQGPAFDVEYGVRRRECFASSVQAMLSGGRGQPLLLIFDDIDQYDHASREIVRRLCASQVNVPVCVLAITAEDDIDWLGGIVEPLEPLGPEVVRQLAEQVIRDVSPSSSLPEALAEVAPLTPFCLESHLRLLAMGVQAPGSASAEELLATRLDGLDGSCRHVLELASILGERFLEQDLVELFEAEGQGDVLRAAFDESLARLHVEGLLVVIGKGERAFSHAILHEVVHGRVPPDQRRRLHAICARTWALARASTIVRAVHLVRAGSPEALPALQEAARRAERRFDDDSAVDFFRAALKASSALPPGRERDAAEISILQNLARVVRSADQAAMIVDLLTDRLRRGVNPEAEIELLLAAGEHLARIARHDDALESLKKALAAAFAVGDRSAMVRIYALIGRVYAEKEDYTRAIQELEEGLDMFTLGEGPRTTSDLDLWRYLLKIGDYCRLAGDLTGARRWCEHALFQAERHEDRLGIMRSHAQMAWVLRDLRQLALAEQHLARALDEARHFGDRLTTAELLIERARARAARGRLAEARRCCEEALRLANGIQWAGGIEHAQRAIAMLTRNQPPPTRHAPAEHSGTFGTKFDSRS